MRLLILSIFLIFSSALLANREISTQIHDIDMGTNDEEPLIFLSTGQVVTFPKGDKSFLTMLKQAILSKKWFIFTINEEREIVEFKKIPPVENTPLKTFDKFNRIESSYSPSVLKDMDHARKFFYEARTNANEESQCFNRAHVWTYEWRINHQLYSSKVWLFFTRKFIRKYKFEWWFHVAPMVHIISENKVKQRIMDIKYAQGPLKLKQWTDIFLRDTANCPVVDKYTDYADHPESGSCFIMKSSMYYYQPADLESFEINGEEKDRWKEQEVRQAYKDAFQIEL